VTHVAAVAVLALCCVAGLVLIPLGLPGLWIMAGGVLAYGALTQFQHVSIAIMAVVLGLAFLGEIVEWWVGFGLAQRYGGSRRAGWGALIGGMVGAIVGVPLPVVGSVIGALIGAFAGAALFEYTVSGATTAVRAGWGAVLGRVAAAAAKIGFGVVIAVIAVVLVASCGGGNAARPSATQLDVRHDEHIFAGATPPPAPSPAAVATRNPFKGDNRSADEGATIFTAMNCDGCHGGGGTGWVGPSLADGRWRFGGSDGAIFESIYYGRPHGMPAYGGLLRQPDAVWKLVTYLQSLEPPADVPTETWR
jgi:uncharacterized protein YqgC (DUF456 family)/mono/diheme cytochrome c family protein